MISQLASHGKYVLNDMLKTRLRLYQNSVSILRKSDVLEKLYCTKDYSFPRNLKRNLEPTLTRYSCYYLSQLELKESISYYDLMQNT